MLKRLLLVALVLCGLSVSAFAAGYNRGGKAGGPTTGLQATIDAVSGSSFTITVNKKQVDGTEKQNTVVVRCDVNTRFVVAGKPAKPTDVVKAGAKVGIQGGTTRPNEIMATTVTLMDGATEGDTTKKKTN